MFSVFLTLPITLIYSFFFFNDTATTEIYTLSLHDALPICEIDVAGPVARRVGVGDVAGEQALALRPRSEEHTSELQSQSNLVCRLLLEKKKKKRKQRSFFSEIVISIIQVASHGTEMLRSLQ